MLRNAITAAIAACLLSSCANAADKPSESSVPPTFTLSADQAQDYVNRLIEEMHKIEAQHQADAKVLQSIQQQASAPAGAKK